MLSHLFEIDLSGGQAFGDSTEQQFGTGSISVMAILRQLPIGTFLLVLGIALLRGGPLNT
jgi:hypothetical protein